MGKIAAGIVLYNSELTRLKENIDSIYSQVEELVLIDNMSDNIRMIESQYSNYKNIKIIKNENNVGIAKALNQIMEFCQSKGYEWVLTLDQDSVCPINIIEEYEKYIEMPDVAIISPVIIDRNKSENPLCAQLENEFQVIDKCITSAALTNVQIWKKLGGFDEIMFIDLVDFEYCKRVELNGYKTIKVNNVVLLHEIGHITQRKFFFWNIDIKNHSAFRKYYMARNIIYSAKKYKKFGSIFVAYARVLKLLFLTFVYEKYRVNKSIAILKGARDGRKIQV